MSLVAPPPEQACHDFILLCTESPPKSYYSLKGVELNKITDLQIGAILEQTMIKLRRDVFAIWSAKRQSQETF